MNITMSVTTDTAGQINVNPRRVKIVTNATFAQVTAAGFLAQAQAEGYTFLPSDFFDIFYSPNTLGTFVFNPNETQLMNLIPSSSGILLPVTVGNVPVVATITGELQDIGLKPSNATKTNIVMLNGIPTIGHATVFSDNQGTIQDSGTTLGTAAAKNIGDFLQTPNNLSDVPVPATARTNLGLGTTSNVTFNSITTPSFSQVSRTGTAILTSADFGKMEICTGSTSYTLTLPSPTGNAGKYIDFTFLPTANALVTLLPPSGDIDNQALLIYGENEGCTLYCDGTQYCVIWQKLFKPSFFVTLSAPLVLPYLTFTKIPFNVITLNNGQFYDPNTNFRFTPLYPGVYSCNLSGQLLVGSSTVNNQFAMSIYKNGSRYFENFTFQAAQIAMFCLSSGLIVFNGTSDYIEAFGFEANTSTFNQPLSNDSATTYFQAIRVSNYTT